MPEAFYTWVLPTIPFAMAAVITAVLAAIVHRYRNYVRTTGEIVGHTERSSDGDPLSYPVVRFTAASGQVVEFRSTVGWNPARDKGARVEVLYDPTDPTHAHVYLSWPVMVIVGAILFCLALGWFGMPR